MNPPRKRVAFGLAVLVGAGLLLAQPTFEAALKWGRSPSATSTVLAATGAEMHPLAPGLFVAGQISPGDVAAAQQRGARAIIAMRPDGEETGQPTARIVGETARSSGIRFAYVPVPHGDMPDAVVNDLAAALSGAGDGPVLLYCRSGRRAARAWALAEASRRGGLSAEEIESAVRNVGQPIDDLSDRIRGRVAARQS